MTRSFTFLVNRASGGGAAPGAVVGVARLLREAGAVVDVTYSPGPEAMARLVADALAREDVVVSVGGDGMLSSLAGPVSAGAGTLGIVPAGRGNDFARMLGVPGSAAEQARVLLDARPRAVDLVAVTLPGRATRVVAGSVYSGVDARAAALVHGMRWVPQRAQYPWAAVRALATYRPAEVELTVDGVQHRFAAATVVVANSAYYGKGMRIAPPADVADGLLDVVVVEAASRTGLMRALPTVYSGRHVARPEVTLLTGRRVELALTSPTPVEVGADGEPLGVLTAPERLCVEVLPAALRVLA